MLSRRRRGGVSGIDPAGTTPSAFSPPRVLGKLSGYRRRARRRRRRRPPRSRLRAELVGDAASPPAPRHVFIRRTTRRGARDDARVRQRSPRATCRWGSALHPRARARALAARADRGSVGRRSRLLDAVQALTAAEELWSRWSFRLCSSSSGISSGALQQGGVGGDAPVARRGFRKGRATAPARARRAAALAARARARACTVEGVVGVHRAIPAARQALRIRSCLAAAPLGPCRRGPGRRRPSTSSPGARARPPRSRCRCGTISVRNATAGADVMAGPYRVRPNRWNLCVLLIS